MADATRKGYLTMKDFYLVRLISRSNEVIAVWIEAFSPGEALELAESQYLDYTAVCILA